MSEHTPEPWFGHGIQLEEDWNEELSLWHVTSDGNAETRHLTALDCDKESAQRIEHALHAVRSIPTEALQDGIIEEMADLLEDMRNHGLQMSHRDQHMTDRAQVLEERATRILDRLDGGDDE